MDGYRKIACRQQRSLGYPEAGGGCGRVGGEKVGALWRTWHFCLFVRQLLGWSPFVDSIARAGSRRGGSSIPARLPHFRGMNRIVWKANLQALFMVISIVQKTTESPWSQDASRNFCLAPSSEHSTIIQFTFHPAKLSSVEYDNALYLNAIFQTSSPPHFVEVISLKTLVSRPQWNASLCYRCRCGN